MKTSLDELADRVVTVLSARPRLEYDQPRLRRAAVLVPLFLADGRVHVLLTKRTETVEHHKGQVSLPGGSSDAGDADAVATALRETEEELGIPPHRVRVLGVLDDVPTFISGFVVTPVVGVIPHPLDLRISADEISEILIVPLDTFQDPSRVRVEERERDGERVQLFFYHHEGHEIWGATARILKGFVEQVFGSERPSEGQK
ncbi:MAG TPA: CoA pyrophosphatase [bacterium]|nr:CoA pyrophosphatase [bacterium]